MQERKRYDFIPKVLYQNRHCNQDDLSILVCGGMNKDEKVENSVYKLDGRKLNCEKFTSMPNQRSYCKTVVTNSDLFVIGGDSLNYNVDKTVEKFCTKTNTWSYETRLILDDNAFFACSFMKNLYVVYKNGLCFVFNLKYKNWSELAKMKQVRYYGACTVFDGKIVVTGSFNCFFNLNSVEAYDYYDNKWTYLPNLIERRCNHASVSMGNKLFVIGGEYTNSCEVFDSVSTKFNIVTYAPTKCLDICEAVCVGNKIMVFSTLLKSLKTNALTYDVINDTWSENKFKLVNNMIGSSYIKYNLH